MPEHRPALGPDGHRACCRGGIFLPVLPTVPFFLLALACFARSSERFYTWLVEHAHFGPLIRPYLQGEGIPRKTRRKAIGLLWICIGVSVLIFIDVLWLKGLLLVIATGVTVYLLRLPTYQAPKKPGC